MSKTTTTEYKAKHTYTQYKIVDGEFTFGSRISFTKPLSDYLLNLLSGRPKPVDQGNVFISGFRFITT